MSHVILSAHYCSADQLQAAGKLMAYCLSCTLLSFDSYLGHLRSFSTGYLHKLAWHSHWYRLTDGKFQPPSITLDEGEKTPVNKF